MLQSPEFKRVSMASLQGVRKGKSRYVRIQSAMRIETRRRSASGLCRNRKEHRRMFDSNWDSEMPPLYEVIRPAYCVLRVFGLAPYVLSKDAGPTRIRVSNVYCLFSLFSAVFYCIVIYWMVNIYEKFRKETPVIGYTITFKVSE
jgi:hypothetical protein